MKVQKYTHSTFRKSTSDIIDAGVSNENSQIIKLHKKYKHPKFYPRKFERWPDTFSVTMIDDETIEVRRTDVKVGGWGEKLIIDVEHENNNILEELPPQKIPRVIYQTFEDYDVPDGMYKSIKSWVDLNTEYEHYFFNGEDRINFIEKNFDNRVLEAYLKLLPGAFKADLWRCCVLYIKGGVYVDSDMICLRSLNELIDELDTFIISRDDPMSTKYLHNGFIATIPNHPFLKKQIDNIVDNVENQRVRYHLDISGPGLLGKSVNELCGRNEHNEFELGINKINDYEFKVLKHVWQSKNFIYNDIPILITEYPNKNTEMDKIGNPTYYSMYQRGEIYQSIPFNIYYTSYDHLGICTYMYNSFKEKNKRWSLNHYTDQKCLEFFKEKNNELIESLGVNVLDYYLTLENGGEKSDLWRYCILYLNGGVYTDTDTYCNVPLSKWVRHHDLILGVEAFLPINVAESFGMDKIGFRFGDKIISVCNWTMASKPKHDFFKGLIIDICNNPIIGNVLLNTGPGRLSKHVYEYFKDSDFNKLSTENIEKEKSILFNINKFGSNQTHSGASKNFRDPFTALSDDVYVTHMFNGSWRTLKNKNIETFKSKLGVSHNMTITKTDNGYLGIGRLDKDTSRTHFMKKIGDCRSLVEYKLDNNFRLIEENEREIKNYGRVAKFEDYRFFKFKEKTYLSVSYIDEDFNTKVSILDENYNFLGDVKIDTYNYVSWVGVKKIWEKNWLFFEKEGELYFIYSTMPNYVLYKCVDFNELKFEKTIDIEWPLKNTISSKEYYFTSYIGSDIKISVGGSTSPIYLKDRNVYLYFVHTRNYNEQKYNHYAVLLDQNLTPIKLLDEPVIKKYTNYGLMFVSSVVETEDYLVFTGGVHDNTNFVWQLSKSYIFKLLGL
jgi:mannosyltransferase OCH1-like enzyme